MKSRLYRPIVSFGNSPSKSIYAICHICPWSWCWGCKEDACQAHKKNEAQALTQSIQHASCNHHFNINFAWINLQEREHSLRTCFSFGGHSTWLVAFTTAMSRSCHAPQHKSNQSHAHQPTACHLHIVQCKTNRYPETLHRCHQEPKQYFQEPVLFNQTTLQHLENAFRLSTIKCWTLPMAIRMYVWSLHYAPWSGLNADM